MTFTLNNYNILYFLLPAVLSPILAAVVAAIGLRRWRPTILTLAIVGLILSFVGVILFHNPLFDTSAHDVLTGNSNPMQEVIAAAALKSGVVIGSIGVFYALILTARARRWGWFTTITTAAVISAIAGVALLSPSILFDFLSNEQVHSLASVPGFKFIMYAIASLSLMVMILFALLSRGSPVTFAAPSMSDEVTLP
jgi:hypothetical protein